MKILILDDTKARHETFQRIYADHEVVSTYKYSEFLRELTTRKWDLIHLDHDLGDDVSDADSYVDGWGCVRQYDGCHAVMRICELDDGSLPGQVIVHSINNSGAPHMVRMLERIGVQVTWEPFGEPT